MATAATSLGLPQPVRHILASGAKAADLRAASALILGLLTYGAVMKLLSGAPWAELGLHIANYAALSAYSALLILCGYTLLCLLRPDARQDLGAKLLWLATAWAITTLIFPFFAMFKELVLPQRGFLWDRTFAHLGRLLFGVSPWTITHEMFGTVGGTRLLDAVYRGWAVFMFGLPSVAATMVSDSRLRFRIIASWTLSWLVIGTIAAWFFASAGPCFFNATVGHDADYAELLRRLAVIGKEAAAQGHWIPALNIQPSLLQTFRTHQFASVGGISAMPSMHLAMATLFVIASSRINRWAGFGFVVFGLLVWISTVHFGLHYIVDAPVAAALMLATWWMSWPLSAIFYSPSEVVGELSQ
jgi:hypothetical protein